MLEIFNGESLDMILFFVLIIVVFAVIVSLEKFMHYCFDKKNAVLKIPESEYTQDQIYISIRKGIDECNNIHDMQDYFRSIKAYERTYPDKEGQSDTITLLNEYNFKIARLLSPVEYQN